MAYSGAFMRGSAVQLAAPPDLSPRHGQRRQPDNNWSPPVAEPAQLATAGDLAAAETPPMAGPGIVRDLGHQYGHRGTGATAGARRPFTGPDAQQLAAAASANAHADARSGYVTSHRYSPAPSAFAGESYGVDTAEGRPGVPRPVRGIVHATPGGQHSDGTSGDVAPTGYRLGVARRWAHADYTSPTLAAQHSGHAARGVLPQTIAVPVDQPAKGKLNNSGLSSQQRHRAPLFVKPRLFHSPPSASDSALAERQAASVVGPVI